MSKGLQPPRGRFIWRDADMEVALTFYPPHARMLPHHHETLGVSVVIAGLVEECVGADSRQAGVGAAVVKPAGTRHANRFGPAGARLLGIGLRGEAAGLWGRSAGLSRWTWVRETVALRAALRLSRVTGAGMERPAELAETLLLGMADVSTRTARLRGQPPPWLARVRDRLHGEPARVCRVSALAQEAGVHPVHLARVFRRQYGRTVASYLHHLRVLAAAERLAADETPVARIAADAGFADHSHLCRVFGRALGVTPTDFRLTARR
jgi:AraC family transcriptional regulator